MKRSFSYPVRLTADLVDDGFVVAFPDFPEAVTQGDTESEALRQAVDALDEALAGRIKRGEDIPYPSGLGIGASHGLAFRLHPGQGGALRGHAGIQADSGRFGRSVGLR